ncbi:serine/threonine-protein phosphatase 6 regulatory ankyrin repeat subunit A [Sorghum bicolor]|nr:serine/threonine-protein phosphatase 6 regulatory ankyrin repeat subunit A [Sorghum bicolor]|eukprot:XP_021321799.1 serine/threonine-protein phosphatase 6 regulatory ankyrin repeat subunit A [Sorghum bicolor]
MARKVNLREAKGDKGRNALHAAAAGDHLDVCRFLVEELGLNVNYTTEEGMSPVHFAATAGSMCVLKYLLECGVDPAMPDSSRGCTPLHCAAEEGRCEAVRLLLSKGIDVDPVNYRGTPLHLAVSKDQDQVVKILLEHGADPNKVVNHVFSPLMVACCAHSLKCMKLLVEGGADVNLITPYGQTILTEAVDDGLTEIVKFLLEAGADPNIADEDGKIPIMCAAGHAQRELIEMLFPKTRPIPSVPDWSIDGIIRSIDSLCFKTRDEALLEEQIADVKLQGKEAFAKGEYLTAIYFYCQAMNRDPFDATLFANRSICWLRQREGDRALLDAQQCTMMRPDWSKGWYREGAALAFLKDYKRAVVAFERALKLDPASDEIKKALREATDAMKSAAARTEQQNP